MTRDDHRAKCIDKMATALKQDSSSLFLAGENYWKQQAIAAFDALHGTARVNPIEATEEMIMAACATPSEIEDRVECWRAMSERGDLTNPPEGAT